MNQNVINIESKFTCFKDYWSPRVIAELNDYQFKLVKAKGEFVWHTHQETDEAFIIIDGSLKIEFRDRSIDLNPGEMFVVQKGVEQHEVLKLMQKEVLQQIPSYLLTTIEATTKQVDEQLKFQIPKLVEITLRK